MTLSCVFLPSMSSLSPSSDLFSSAESTDSMQQKVLVDLRMLVRQKDLGNLRAYLAENRVSSEIYLEILGNEFRDFSFSKESQMIYEYLLCEAYLYSIDTEMFDEFQTLEKMFGTPPAILWQIMERVVVNNHVDLCTHLLNKFRYQSSIKDSLGMFLEVAISLGYEKICSLLLEEVHVQGVLNKLDWNGLVTGGLLRAVKNGHWETIRIVIEEFVVPFKSQCLLFEEAIRSQQFDIFFSLGKFFSSKDDMFLKREKELFAGLLNTLVMCRWDNVVEHILNVYSGSLTKACVSAIDQALSIGSYDMAEKILRRLPISHHARLVQCLSHYSPSNVELMIYQTKGKDLKILENLLVRVEESARKVQESKWAAYYVGHLSHV